MNNRLFRITAVGVLSGLSVVFVMLVHFPIFPMVSFLEYDPADIPIFVVTAFFGPASGLVMTVAVSVIQGLTVSAQSGAVGIVMHILATGFFVVAESIAIFLLKRAGFSVLLTTVISTVAGVFAMTLVMTAWNMLFTPYFMGVTLSDLAAFMPFIIAFNFLKAAINGGVSAAIYLAIYAPVNKYINKKSA